MKTIACIIPARFASTRFPGKLLELIGHKSIIRHVWERVNEVKRFDRIVIAADDQRILRHCLEFGAEAVMTRPDHVCGTDRVAEAALKIDTDIVVNVQGDEPLIRPQNLDRLVQDMVQSASDDVFTLAFVPPDDSFYSDPNAVKTVVDLNGRALYFSRSPIPYCRDVSARGLFSRKILIHTGVYGFTKSRLQEFSSMKQGELERVESLEQLRLLEHGYGIRVVVADGWEKGVDTPQDLERVKGMLWQNSSL